MIRNLFFTVSLFATTSVFAGQITPEQASTVALRFMATHVIQQDPIRLALFTIREIHPVTDQEIPLYYLFNLNPEGWIAISADDAVFPVLAYSFTGQVDPLNLTPPFAAWMKQYEDQILFAREQHADPLPVTKKMWDAYQDPGSWILDPGQNSSVRDRSGMAPLITTTWNQSPWYNEMCPADPAGPGGHCVAGCVPVCMAQVMYYFRWPETGTGSYTYTEPNYGVLTANFGQTAYRWEQMTNSINRSNPAIAELIYHLGVSCDLQYGPNGSGMYNHKAAYSLRTYFKYAPETQYLFRDSTTLNWDSVLMAHLDKRIPMYYAGWSVPNINGHAFVCDGYQDSCFFHFNFGWGGSNDGYFYTSDLTPGGYNFNLAQEVVINCYPDTLNYTYPAYCNGQLALFSMTGSIEDGSGPVEPYQPTAQCGWLIDPQTFSDSVTDITLSFDRFQTDADDFVTIYDGDQVTDPILGQYSGDQLPDPMTSTGNQMLITFSASGNEPENGFLAHYSANQPVWCSGTTSIKADTAEFSDGSFDFDYYNRILCKWKVETASGEPLTLWFESFDTEAGHDFLTIYDLETGDTLASLSGQYEPGNLPDSVTAPGGKAFLIFNTNSTITANGWKIHYPKKPNIGLPEYNSLSGLTLYPVPSAGQVTCSFRSSRPDNAFIEIRSADGRLLTRDPLTISRGINEMTLSLSGLGNGVYILQIIGQHGSATTKVIKHSF